MGKDAGHILAITLTPRRLRLGIAHRGRKGVEVGSRAEAPLDAAALATPQAFAAAVRAALSGTAAPPKAAAVGLPARWVMTHHHPCPPVGDEQRREIARLQAERLAAGVSDKLTTDYQHGGGGERTGVLIAAVQTARLRAIEAGLREAGLTLRAAVPTALTCPPPSDEPALAVLIEPGSVTALHANDGRWVGLSELPVGDDDPADDAGRARLVAALRRQAVSSPAGLGDRPAVTLFDATGGAAAALEPVRAAIEAGVGPCTMRAVDTVAQVADAAVGRAEPAVNFADTRLAVAPRRQLPKPARWAAIAALIVLAAGLAVGGLWWQQRSELRGLEQEHAQLSTRAAELEQVLDDSRAVAGWFDDRPPVLACMLALTDTFPQRRGLWVTRLSLDDELEGSIQGRALSRELMLEYVAAMRGSPRLDAVVLRDWHETGRDDRVVVFEIAFRFVPGAGGGPA